MKIYIFGYSHCGTTILRKVIGDHSLVDEITWEDYRPPIYKDKPHIVFKAGALPLEIHNDCKRVMIMKNPWDVFGSMLYRFGEEFDSKFGKLLQRYANYLKYFKKETGDFKVRYEDLFWGGLHDVFKYLDLKYEGPKDRESEHRFKPGVDLIRQDLATIKNYELRTKQINSPFTDMTGKSAVRLPKRYSDDFVLHPIIKEVYGEFEYLGNRGR